MGQGEGDERILGETDFGPSQGKAGKCPKVVQALSLACYWDIYTLDMTATALVEIIGIRQTAVSISVKRGETIIRRDGLGIDGLLR